LHWEQICDRKTDRRTGGQTDLHDEAKSCFFFNFAKAPKNRMDPETGNVVTVFLLD